MRQLKVLVTVLAVALLGLGGVADAAEPAAMPPADEHSYAQPQFVRVRDLGLDLRIDFANKQLRGTADLRLQWQNPRHRELLLDSRDLQIERVLGKRHNSGWYKLEWQLGERDPVLGQKLAIRMNRQYDVVRIRYRTSAEASGLQWLQPGMTAGKQLPFMFSQSQAIHARSWVPLQDTPAVRYTYSAHIETDPTLMALMSADNAPDATRDGDYVFRMSQPIPSYLMAIAAGDLDFRALSERSGVWAEPATLDTAANEFADTEKMIQVAEALYGPYRWQRYDLLILPPSFPFGGMENPRLSFITPTVITGDKSLVSLIAHELAHSWSGNLVTNSSWKDIWLNEGFTSYVENRIVEALYGIEQAEMENVISQRDLAVTLAETPRELQVLRLPPQGAGSDPDETLSDVAYIKGQWFLRFLEQRFGRERFDAFLRGWFDQHAFTSVDSQAFVDYLTTVLLPQAPEAISTEELDAWLQAPGIPESGVPSASERFARVDAARKRWLDGEIVASDIDHRQWITQEWVYFLDGMPKQLDGKLMVELDATFHFTGTSNGEVAMRWYPLAVRSDYFEARPAMAAFLQRIGRRKLIMPIYEALAETDEGRKFAREVFAKARPGYHPITTGSVEAALADRAP